MTQIQCPPLTNCGEKAWGLDGAGTLVSEKMRQSVGSCEHGPPKLPLGSPLH